MKKLYGKKIFIDGKFQTACVYYADGIVKRVVKGSEAFDLTKQDFDAGDNYVVPGFIDIHTHGALNVDFADGTPEEIIQAVKYHLSNGSTSILPTVTSSTKDKIIYALSNIEKAMKDPIYGKRILGVHLEGPYLSQAQSGAQEKSLITEPIEKDYREIIEKFGQIIKRWDYAPERDENATFCKYLKENSIIPSAGHTDAIYKDMLTARENGCNLITHFYSCTSTITRELGVRRLGVLECGYLWNDMYIEIIADGMHLPKELLQLIFKLKNREKIILVSDSLKVAGSNDKYSSVGNVKCIIEDGVCKLLDRSAFAGSIASGVRLIKTCVDAGLPLEDAVQSFTKNPAELLKINRGKIEKDCVADFVVLDKNCNVKKVILG
ncbi:MAG: amidohydrolase family protein [Clostridia bacterium]|nr:amidohydrolase family protein [Clostridia bacterium]